MPRKDPRTGGHLHRKGGRKFGEIGVGRPGPVKMNPPDRIRRSANREDKGPTRTSVERQTHPADEIRVPDRIDLPCPASSTGT